MFSDSHRVGAKSENLLPIFDKFQFGSVKISAKNRTRSGFSFTIRWPFRVARTLVLLCAFVCLCLAASRQEDNSSLRLNYLHDQINLQHDNIFERVHRSWYMFAVLMCFSGQMKEDKLRTTKFCVKIKTRGFISVLCRACVLLIFLANLLLLLSHDVEKNPGPGQKTTPQNSAKTLRQSSRTNSKSESTVEEKQNADHINDNERILAAIADIKLSQDTLSTKLTDKLSVMDQSINSNLEDIRSNQAAISQDILALNDHYEDLQQENIRLKNKVDDLEEKVDYLENQSRRNNLIIHGIQTSWKETWDEIEDKVKDMFRTKLGITKDLHIERAHRVGKVIVVKFLSFKDRELVLSKAKLLKDIVPKMYIHPDVSTRVRTKVSALADMRKTYQDQNQKVFIRHDKLITPDGVFTFNLRTEEIQKMADGRSAHADRKKNNSGVPLRSARRKETDTNNTETLRSARHEDMCTNNRQSDSDSQSSVSEARGAVGGLPKQRRGRPGRDHSLRRGGKDDRHGRNGNFSDSDNRRFRDSSAPGHEWC